jgi:hypothetical protein
MTCSKKIFPLLALLFLLNLFADALAAQTRPRSSRDRDRDRNRERKKEKDEDEMQFKDRIWIGGSLNLGFGAFNGQSTFSFGLAPMVGYKFGKVVSAGPRVSVLYTSLKQPGFKALSLFDIEAGAFVRAKVFRGFFIQGELANEWAQFPNELLPNNRISKITRSRFNQYLGAGYNFGGGPGTAGSEIGVFYNFAVANDINTFEQPMEYRFGFTWNF